MTKAILYLRSATGNREQTDRQEETCREYLQERGLFDPGTFTESGPAPRWAHRPHRHGHQSRDN
ncbi:hypothetical protein [Brevibacterium luteolum]|uniref:hypothetical protein n=1 Tax=Brevibacterium luteolum TaxID=199591 RepID=UPI001C22E497|nr:hypothetical protein [Brevibacterium luteolum]MBU8577652.1 hypothetical protein [Brevibacterium luteolum]